MSETPSDNRRQASIDFAVARARALDSYAALETHTGLLFKDLLQAKNEAGSYLVFAQLTARAQRELISALVQQHHGAKFNTFLKSLLGQMSKVTNERNKIVHWVSESSNKMPPHLREHPNLYGRKTRSKSDIEKFTAKSDFIGLLIYYFWLYLKFGDRNSIANETPWRQIFQQRVHYPPAKGHPLSQSHKEPEGQPPPSRPSHPRQSPAQRRKAAMDRLARGNS